MTGSVLSTGDGHQGWQDKLSIMMVLELSICLKTGAMTLKTVLDKGYSSFAGRGSLAAERRPQIAGRKLQAAAECWRLTAGGHSLTAVHHAKRSWFADIGGRRARPNFYNNILFH